MSYLIAFGITFLLSFIIILLFKARHFYLKSVLWLKFLVLILFISGFWLIIMSANTYNTFHNMQNWREAKALILDTKVTGERAKRPEISYQYSVNGKTYQGKSNLQTPGFGAKKSRAQTARNILKDYKKGSTIIVHYDPNDIAISKVIVKTPWNVYMQYSLGILFLTITFSLTGNFLIGKQKQE